MDDLPDLRRHWRDDAACANRPKSMFVKDARRWERTKRIGALHVQRGIYRAALNVCESCPVQGPCLDYALAVGDQIGVYGGTVPYERHALVQTGRRKVTA